MGIKVAILTDAADAWGSPIDEQEQGWDRDMFIGYLREWFPGEQIDIMREAHTFDELGYFTADLFIVDYGGTEISQPLVARMEVRKVANWAAEHQNSVVLIWTPYTGRALEEALVQFDICDRLPIDKWAQRDNIIVRGYAWDNEPPEMIQAIRMWLGLPVEV